MRTQIILLLALLLNMGLARALHAQDEALSVSITTEPQSYSLVGETIIYDISVTNISGEDLVNVRFSQPNIGVGEQPTVPADLAPGETGTASTSYTITQADVDAGMLATNIICMGDSTSSGGTVSLASSVSITAIQAPEITLTQNIRSNTCAFVDSLIVFELLVVNTGNVSLYDVSVSHEPTGTNQVIDILAPFEQQILNLPYSVTQADVNAGTVTATATSSGTTLLGETVTEEQEDLLNLTGFEAIIFTTFSGDSLLCEGFSTRLSPLMSCGPGPYIYEWEPTETLSCTDCRAPFATPTETTTYSVTITDAAGNTTVASRTLTLLPLPELNVLDITYQDCNSFTLTAQAEHPNPDATGYSILFPDGSMITGPYGVPFTHGPMPLAADISVVVTDGESGCSLILEIPIPPISPPTFTDATVVQASCESSSDGSIELGATGGLPPYTIDWPSGIDVMNLAAGTYAATVTDANGCQAVTEVEVGIELTVSIDPDGEAILDCITNQVLLTGSSSVNGPNIRYDWFGPDGSSISDQAAITVNEPGEYRFRATNTEVGDCFSESTVTVEAFNLDSIPEAGIIVEQLGCNSYQLIAFPLPAWYTGPKDHLWTFPDGSTMTGDTIVPDQSGVYLLRYSTVGCNQYLSQIVNLEAEACATISGTVAQDLNEDCIYDMSEPVLPNWVVQAVGSEQAFFALTDEEGRYEFSLPLDDYTVSVLPLTSLWTPCGPYAVVLDTEGQHEFLDFAVGYMPGCGELSVQLSTPFLRRCFNSLYYVQVCNIGTEAATAPEVQLTLDDFLSFQNAQIDPDFIEGQTIHWTLDDLDVGQCHNFWVRVRVSCDAVLGQAHCSEATAVNSPFCLPGDEAWSGANLGLSGECIGDLVRFTVTNEGTAPMVQALHHIAMEDVVMLSDPPIGIGPLGVGQEATFEYPANGSTYTFRVDQEAGHPFEYQAPTLTIEGCGINEAGAFSTGFTAQLPIVANSLASDILCVPNQGAFDPNDKQALPIGYGEPHYIRAGEPLNYLVRFQNTGTDTAFTVVIRDTLSPWLDMSSLRLGNSSHPYRASIEDERTLVFTFDNILLPDSTTNLEASQGFVDFDIRTLADTPLETILYNQAAIYFDFNEPIFTNTVFHTIGEDFILVSTKDESGQAVPTWRLYPNPSRDRAVLELLHARPRASRLALYDAQGQLLRVQAFSGQQVELDVSKLPAGLYIVQLQDENGRPLGADKLIVR